MHGKHLYKGDTFRGWGHCNMHVYVYYEGHCKSHSNKNVPAIIYVFKFNVFDVKFVTLLPGPFLFRVDVYPPKKWFIYTHHHNVTTFTPTT